MGTVVVAGAGASLAQAQSYRPKQTREHPHLDANFFESAATLAGGNREIGRTIARFRETLTDSSFLDPFHTSPPSGEQFFADVYYEVASSRQPRAFRTFVELLRLYNQVIGATTNWVVQTKRLGVLDRLIRHEKKLSHGTLTVITFNQDLVLERVAARFPRISGKWCLRSLYGDITLSPIVFPEHPTFPYHKRGCIHQAPFTLLKLHGSLNWAVRTLRPDPQITTLFPSRKTRAVFQLDAQTVFNRPTVTSSSSRGRKKWYLWPLVVPPIYDKSRITGMTVLEQVWAAASKAIEAANKLVVVGYSMPDADTSSAQMLRRAFARNQTLKCIECINPDMGVAAKISERLDCRVLRVCTDIPRYLTHSPRSPAQ